VRTTKAKAGAVAKKHGVGRLAAAAQLHQDCWGLPRQGGGGQIRRKAPPDAQDGALKMARTQGKEENVQHGARAYPGALQTRIIKVQDPYSSSQAKYTKGSSPCRVRQMELKMQKIVLKNW